MWILPTSLLRSPMTSDFTSDESRPATLRPDGGPEPGAPLTRRGAIATGQPREPADQKMRDVQGTLIGSVIGGTPRRTRLGSIAEWLRPCRFARQWCISQANSPGLHCCVDACQVKASFARIFGAVRKKARLVRRSRACRAGGRIFRRGGDHRLLAADGWSLMAGLMVNAS
jgi:hypothetical protein